MREREWSVTYGIGFVPYFSMNTYPASPGSKSSLAFDKVNELE